MKLCGLAQLVLCSIVNSSKRLKIDATRLWALKG